jgi:hypothetical protein
MNARSVLSALKVPAGAAGLAVLTTSLAGATMAPVRRPAAPQATRTRTATVRSAATPAQTTAKSFGTATLVSVRVTWGNENTAPVPAIDKVRRRIMAACQNPGADTNQYALEGWRVTPGTTAHVNLAGAPGGAFGAIQGAFSAWSANGAPAIGVAGDGVVTRPTANHQDDIMFGSPGGALAVTFTWRWSNGPTESDIVLNRSKPWFQAPGEGDGCFEGVGAYDIQDIATHEVGHLYGLAHANGSPFNTMFPRAMTGETYKRSPAAGDILGIHAIYG